MAENALLVKDIEDQKYRGFACPQEGLDLTYLEDITVQHSRKIVRNFVERFRAELDQHGYGMTGLLEKWLGHETSFDEVWNVAFGEVRAANVSKMAEPENWRPRAANLVLRLHEGGLRGSWGLRLDHPVRLRWGRWLLPTADQVEVTAGTDLAKLKLSLNGTVQQLTFWRNAEGWQADVAEALPILKNKITLLPLSALDTGEFDGIRAIVCEEVSQSIVDGYEEAFSILREYASVYLPWVARGVRQIVPVTFEPGKMTSGNSVLRPGVVYTSCDVAPVALAELLVHESSHEHLHMLRQVGRLEDGSDKQLYYSPIRKEGRPVLGILLAYHALGNMLLFYRLCLENGFANKQYCIYNENDILPQLVELEKALKTTTALTPLGQALWHPLREQIFS